MNKGKYLSVYMKKALADMVKAHQEKWDYSSTNKTLIALIELGLVKSEDDYKFLSAMKYFNNQIEDIKPILEKIAYKNFK